MVEGLKTQEQDRAIHDLHRFVALKFLPDEVARDSQALVRFQREAQALQGINLLPGSFMTGQIRWAVYGGIAVASGIALLFGANRSRKG